MRYRILLVALASLAAGCGGTDSSDSSAPSRPTEAPTTTAKPSEVSAGTTTGDIEGVPLPDGATLVVEDSAPDSSNLQQETYSVPLRATEILAFFDAEMPKAGFRKSGCNETDGVPQCLYRKANRGVGVEYENGRFVLTEITQ